MVTRNAARSVQKSASSRLEISSVLTSTNIVNRKLSPCCAPCHLLRHRYQGQHGGPAGCGLPPGGSCGCSFWHGNTLALQTQGHTWGWYYLVDSNLTTLVVATCTWNYTNGLSHNKHPYVACSVTNCSDCPSRYFSQVESLLHLPIKTPFSHCKAFDW